MNDRIVNAVFATVALAAGCFGVIVPVHSHFQSEARAKVRLTSGPFGAAQATSVREILATIEKGSPPDALVQDIVLYQDHIVVIVEDPGAGSLRTWQIDDSGNVAAEGTSDATSDYGVKFARIDPTIPERMARTVLARVHRPDVQFNYVTASISPPHMLRWVLYLQHGPVRDRSWIADGDGTNLRRQG